MAEIATGIVHDVGNVLNSGNVSADLVMAKLAGSRVAQLSKVAGLLDEHKNELGEFMTSNAKFQFRTFSGSSGEGCEVREQVTINIALCGVERHVR